MHLHNAYTKQSLRAAAFAATALYSSAAVAADIVPGKPVNVDVAEYGHDDHAGGHYEEKIEGLPQLDFSTYPSQIFWLFIAFIILYFIYSKKTLPEISATIENRHNQVDGDLDTATKLKEEADGVQAAYEEILSKARADASDIFKKTEDKIKDKTEKKMADFRERSHTLTQDTEAEVAKAKDDAMGDMQSIAAEVASIAAEKIVGISPDIDQAKTLVKNMNKKAA